MPTSSEIARIQETVAAAYSIDLNSIKVDDVAVQTIAESSKAIDAIDLYVNGSTYSSGLKATIPDLESFAFADVPIDPSLFPRRVEQNLDEALRILQSCLQLRQTYMDGAKLLNDTKFKLEEFMRLDFVHQREVAAGLYELPWQESADDVIALRKSIAEAEMQEQVVEDMLDGSATGSRFAGILTDPRVQAYITAAAQLAKDSASFNRELIQAGATQTTTYRAGFDAATWSAALASMKSNLAQLRGRLSMVLRKETYLKKDAVFRTHRAAISRQIAYLQADELSRKNSIINYAERLEQQAELFRTYLRHLIERASALQTGLVEAYKLAVPLRVPVAGHILDDLAVWLTAVQNELAKYKRRQRSVIRSVWSSGLTPSGKGGPMSSLDKFETKIMVDDGTVPNLDARLRGVAFEYLGDQRLPISLEVTPPSGAYLANTRIDGAPDVLQFGRTCVLAPELDLKPQHTDALWNGSPFGEWQVSGLYDQTRGPIEKIAMHLWLVEI
ncbi:hypothetical protein [Mesorhizobium sp.]|uniref:hypothetical protein n=1 Tax=Mesorhizobium sp. TaxID=1871066 RepID=UPI000FEA5F9C|nr:hypothetical protein [Mesorhizobium sp.]RWI99974.1 MAG: hypothetical protein EOR23_31960 [Mesorhizobium sp.]RWM04971.1 MAG: hypothetical protein EOR71_25605 [Mesorhizobium sp.]RWO82167.1 MAG: hypothetical protein EOQ95_27645 [Mesorhizobium sp.]